MEALTDSITGESWEFELELWSRRPDVALAQRVNKWPPNEHHHESSDGEEALMDFLSFGESKLVSEEDIGDTIRIDQDQAGLEDGWSIPWDKHAITDRLGGHE